MITPLYLKLLKRKLFVNKNAIQYIFYVCNVKITTNIFKAKLLKHTVPNGLYPDGTSFRNRYILTTSALLPKRCISQQQK